jgi:hypothetical protein
MPERERRRPYRLTRAGKAALAAELASLDHVVLTGRTRLAVP